MKIRILNIITILLIILCGCIKVMLPPGEVIIKYPNGAEREVEGGREVWIPEGSEVYANEWAWNETGVNILSTSSK